MHRFISSALLAAALTAPASAQAFSETFSGGTIGSWTETNSGTGVIWENTSQFPWVVLYQMPTDAAGHLDYWVTTSNCNDYLTSPSFSLVGYATPELTFDSEILGTLFMAYAPWGGGNGASEIDVSVDGGVTWSQIWTESAILNGLTSGISVDLSSVAANEPNCQMRLHYFGNSAHSWGVDNIVIDNGGNPTGPSLSVAGSCPGAMSLDASGMTISGPVVFAYAFGAGSFSVPGGACAGLSLPLSIPVQLGTVPADAGGNASFGGTAPAVACGLVHVIAVDGASCTATNAVQL